MQELVQVNVGTANPPISLAKGITEYYPGRMTQRSPHNRAPSPEAELAEATGVLSNHVHPRLAPWCSAASENQRAHVLAKAAEVNLDPIVGAHTTSMGAPSSLRCMQPAGIRKAALCR